MGANFIDDFIEDDTLNDTAFYELQSTLMEAIKTSKKSSITVHYPRNNYGEADYRLHIKANLNAIRQNINNEKAIKIYLDFILNDGTYSSDINPNIAKTEMSYAKFSNLICYEFVYYVIKPLLNKLKSLDDKYEILSGQTDAIVGISKKATTKKVPATLKCEVKLESVDESGDGETVVEPTRQKMRSMFLKATTNKNKYKFLIKSTLENKKYDYVEVNYNEDGLIVSLIKDEIVEQSKSVNSTVAYRVVNEYIKCEDINIDSIEQDVLSQPPKPKPVQQSNNSYGAGCLTAAIPIVCFLIYIILKFFD